VGLVLLSFDIQVVDFEDIILYDGFAEFFQINGKIITQSLESLALFYFRESLERKA
jgi:hypothetical protein